MSAAKIIKRAQADGVSIAMSPVGTLKISGDPANVSRWAAVVKSHKSEIMDTLTVLQLAGSDFFTHKDTCPTCSMSWAATASCEEHGELWLAYRDALVSVHGANLVDGLPELPPEPPASKDAPMGTNGYRTVPTAHIKPQSWIVTRDALHSHWFTCQRCKPSGACSEGVALRDIYNQQNSLTEFST